MSEKRHKYDREFRNGTVRIVNETNKPIAVIARAWMDKGTLGNWVIRDREKRQGTDGFSAGCIEELKRLRAEVAQLRMERDVLIRTSSRAGPGSAGLTPRDVTVATWLCLRPARPACPDPSRSCAYVSNPTAARLAQ